MFLRSVTALLGAIAWSCLSTRLVRAQAGKSAVPGEVSVDDTNQWIKFQGPWTEFVDTRYFNYTSKYTTEKGAIASFKFMGESLKIYGISENADFTVTVDGEESVIPRLLSDTNQSSILFSHSQLDPTVQHLVVLNVTSAGKRFNFDAVVIGGNSTSSNAALCPFHGHKACQPVKLKLIPKAHGKPSTGDRGLLNTPLLHAGLELLGNSAPVALGDALTSHDEKDDDTNGSSDDDEDKQDDKKETDHKNNDQDSTKQTPDKDLNHDPKLTQGEQTGSNHHIKLSKPDKSISPDAAESPTGVEDPSSQKNHSKATKSPALQYLTDAKEGNLGLLKALLGGGPVVKATNPSEKTPAIKVGLNPSVHAALNLTNVTSSRHALVHKLAPSKSPSDDQPKSPDETADKPPRILKVIPFKVNLTGTGLQAGAIVPNNTIFSVSPLSKTADDILRGQNLTHSTRPEGKKDDEPDSAPPLVVFVKPKNFASFSGKPLVAYTPGPIPKLSHGDLPSPSNGTSNGTVARVPAGTDHGKQLPTKTPKSTTEADPNSKTSVDPLAPLKGTLPGGRPGGFIVGNSSGATNESHRTPPARSPSKTVGGLTFHHLLTTHHKDMSVKLPDINGTILRKTVPLINEGTNTSTNTTTVTLPSSTSLKPTSESDPKSKVVLHGGKLVQVPVVSNGSSNNGTKSTAVVTSSHSHDTKLPSSSSQWTEQQGTDGVQRGKEHETSHTTKFDSVTSPNQTTHAQKLIAPAQKKEEPPSYTPSNYVTPPATVELPPTLSTPVVQPVDASKSDPSPPNQWANISKQMGSGVGGEPKIINDRPTTPRVEVKSTFPTAIIPKGSRLKPHKPPPPTPSLKSNSPSSPPRHSDSSYAPLKTTIITNRPGAIAGGLCGAMAGAGILFALLRYHSNRLHQKSILDEANRNVSPSPRPGRTSPSTFVAPTEARFSENIASTHPYARTPTTPPNKQFPRALQLMPTVDQPKPLTPAVMREERREVGRVAGHAAQGSNASQAPSQPTREIPRPASDFKAPRAPPAPPIETMPTTFPTDVDAVEEESAIEAAAAALAASHIIRFDETAEIAATGSSPPVLPHIRPLSRNSDDVTLDIAFQPINMDIQPISAPDVPIDTSTKDESTEAKAEEDAEREARERTVIVEIPIDSPLITRSQDPTGWHKKELYPKYEPSRGDPRLWSSSKE
ncbi:BQ2448_2555 [Microbotryum intermedium]|uniref:BQ2448_2555 protein n=1 Tax=Microbotryum intermedium TaxID=269621 RepID=A0A238F8L2_9BASI|nr:BQ2448_2555 [Microbotryum intermedium]